MDIGNNLKRQSIEIDPDLLLRGVKDAMSGGETLLTGEEARETLIALQKDLMAKEQERRNQVAEKNKMEGEAFLTGNKGKEGVVTLPSGLQYKVVKPGDGPSPKETDTVETNYRGTLIDGTEFDSSYKRGQAAVFPVKGVIRGWTEALQLMKVGGKWQLYVPPELAYGERGAGPIGPNATLIFDVELLSIKENEGAESAGQNKPANTP
jgi:FKBP-type peptidyl-prolyl cis-trans isomerase FklB